MFPRRGDEILPGGSLYWVIRGLILCRQPIAGLEPVKGADGIERCRIVFKPKIIPVHTGAAPRLPGLALSGEGRCAARSRQG